jgi:hypothetical protein
VAIHIIPEEEKQYHWENPECPCGPKLEIDSEKTGEMVWIHFVRDWDEVLEDFVQI